MLAEWASARHRAAIRRADLSRPIRLGREDGIITEQTVVFDYGCGHGDDVKRLMALGIPASGWDPVHATHAVKRRSDVVNLGFVLNVIENPTERVAVIQEAWSLASGVLIVAVRTTADQRDPGLASGDGFVTALGTFQKYFEHDEFKNWLEAAVGQSVVTAGPGIFYLFRDSERRALFLESRFRSRVVVPRISQASALFEAHRPLLEELVARATVLGRAPEADEWDGEADTIRALGSVARAFAIVQKAIGDAAWSGVRDRRTDDLTVLLAVGRFDGKRRVALHSDAVQREVRAFFGSEQRANKHVDRALATLKDMALVAAAMRSSPVGKLTPGAFYLHTSALDAAHVVVRLYEACARAYIGRVDGANLIKLSRETPKVSYLSYPDFDEQAHPALERSVQVSLQTFRLRVDRYDERDNPPILHRKELFVLPDYPGRDAFEAFTKEEEAAGLYADPVPGTLKEWNERVRRLSED